VADVVVDPFELIVVGSCMTDLITTVPRMPRLGETLVGSSFAMGFGGKGANQAVMAARLGARVAMVARVGADEFGRGTIDNFRRQGVDARHVAEVAGVASGVAPITVQADGQNAVLIVPGANDTLGADDVTAALTELGAARVVLCQLEVPDAAVVAAFRWARAHGALTILNPAPARAVPTDVLDLVDVVVPNETELVGLTGIADGANPLEVARGARLLRRHGAQTVIVTLGERGAWVLDGADERLVGTGQVRAVDTTGAGDAFVGTLALLLARGVAVAPATEIACRAATATVQRPGTQTSYPSAHDLEALGVDLPPPVTPAA
jgi:ribokinase